MADQNMNSKKRNNILRYRKRIHWNIGSILFIIIFIYLLAMVIIYLTVDRTTPYEVRMGSILNDMSYTGIALREETVVTAKKAGYVNYYSTENAKVKVGSKVYILSPDAVAPGEYKSSGGKEQSRQLTGDQQTSIGLLVHSFTERFSDEIFSEVYGFKDSVTAAVADIFSKDKENYFNELLKTDENTLVRSQDDGIIVYSSDGLEGLTKEMVTQDILNKTDYTCTEFSNNMNVSAGDPVFKLITSEKWSVIVPVSEETAQLLKKKKSVKVRFLKDKQTLIAGVHVDKREDGQYLACLRISSGMIRYAGDRFLDLELILEDAAGLKIPKSALTKKSFYIVPLEYIRTENETSVRGVYRKKKGKNGQLMTEFVPVTVYYTENGMGYIDPQVLNEGDILTKEESNVVHVIRDKKDLTGVFNINKGYAVFKQIRILCESDDYYIVEAGNDYGVANYDHIALDSRNIKENDLITQ